MHAEMRQLTGGPWGLEQREAAKELIVLTQVAEAAVPDPAHW